MEKDNIKSKKIVIISSITVIIAGILFLSFSYFTPSITEENNYTTSGGADARTPDITYTDLSSGITINQMYPMTDEEGLLQPSYSFKIQNNESESVVYDIYLQTETGNTVADNLASISFNNSDPKVLNSFPTDNPTSGYSHSYKIKTGELLGGANKSFELKVWANEAGTVETVKNKTWKGKIFVKARFGMVGSSAIKNLVSGANSSSTDVITKTAPEGATCTNTLAYDGTVDNNLRYVGVDPCNYVLFNGETPVIEKKWILADALGVRFSDYDYASKAECELDNDPDEEESFCQERQDLVNGWRIIGVMNNVVNNRNMPETRIKLVRASLGNYSWDTGNTNGINDWTQADIKNELNGDYLDTTLSADTMWYNGLNNQQTGVYDHTKGLTLSSQNLIDDALWYLGGTSSQSTNSSGEGTPAKLYEYERGTTVYSGRPTQWTGKVGLIYPSDYSFASGGSNHSACLESNAFNWWKQYEYADCSIDNWISSSTYFLGTITPADNSPSEVIIAQNYLDDAGGILSMNPVVYLKPEVIISSGDGSLENPYILG